MEYQKIINLLYNTPNQPTKFSTKNWVEINDGARGTYNKNSQIKFKKSTVKLCLCDYRDAYIPVSGTVKIDGTGSDDNVKRLDERNKVVIFKNCVPFTDCISETNNTQIDNATYLDVVMWMHSLVEYRNNYLKTSASLWQYYRNDPNDILTKTESFEFKIKITGKSPTVSNTKEVKKAVPLKYLNNFRRTLEIPLVNCEINLILTWSRNCVIYSVTGKTKFAIIDTKLFV